MYIPIIRKAEKLVERYNNVDDRTEKLAKEIHSLWVDTVSADGRPPSHPNQQITTLAQAEWYWGTNVELIKRTHRVLTVEAVNWARDTLYSSK
tara:strand:- start:4470 stop:4748 length:279 start_codon:yes stop_codon:yes gene_type:complete